MFYSRILRLALLLATLCVLNACASPPAAPTIAPQAAPPSSQTTAPVPAATQGKPSEMVVVSPAVTPPMPTQATTLDHANTLTPISTLAPPSAKFAWTKLDSHGSPPARFDHALALVPDKQELVLFGGRAGSETFADTWIYDLKTNQWRQVNVQGPSARFGMGAVYDAAHKTVLLFGGQQSTLYNDTWAFDTEKETWSEIQTQGDKPDTRYGHGTALDTARERLIVSHGFAKDGRHNDTWALDLASNRWQNITPAGDKPLNRCLLKTDYAPATDLVYLFGGCSSGFGPCPQGDLWSLDLKTNQWTLLSPDGATPSARENPSLVVDSKTGNLILFGGKSDSPLDDLWVFDVNAKTWKQITVQGPGARKSHDAVYDAANNRVYLFGGSTAGGAVNDLWMLEL